MICLHLVIHASLFFIDDLELCPEDSEQKGFEFHVHLVIYNIANISSCDTFLSSPDIESPSKFEVVSLQL